MAISASCPTIVPSSRSRIRDDPSEALRPNKPLLSQTSQKRAQTAWAEQHIPSKAVLKDNISAKSLHRYLTNRRKPKTTHWWHNNINHTGDQTTLTRFGQIRYGLRGTDRLFWREGTSIAGIKVGVIRGEYCHF